MTTFTTSIAASADDAVELSGSMTLNGANLNANSATQLIGMRFTGVTIPPGSTINSAFITVNITSASFDDPDLTIRGSADTSSTTFTSTANDITNRFKTTASVAWSASNIGTGNKNSPSLVSIISEIIAIPGWASGNALSIYLTGSATSSFRCFSFDNGSNIPSITIDYTAPGGSAGAKIRRVPLLSKVGGALT